MSETKYTSVAKLAAGLLEDPAVEAEMNERLARRHLINCLVAERAKRNLSQADIAKKMGVSVSKISRMEDSLDDDIRLGELKGYVSTLNLKLSMLLSDDSLPTAERIKHCVFRIEDMLKQLTALAQQCNDDKSIVDGILRFRGEVLFNFIMKYQETGKDFPVFSSDDGNDADSLRNESVVNRDCVPV